MDIRTAIIGTVALGIGAGVATLALSPLAVAPSRPCNPPSQIMSRLELLFGMKKPDGNDVAEEEWRAFLDAEVTPRFPDGLTVYEAAGQWWDKSSRQIIRESSKIVLIVLPGQAEDHARLNEIADAYKRSFRQQSVGVIVRPACVAF